MENVRTSIVEAAAEMFAESPAGATVEAVCGRAGVERRTFDEHFADVDSALGAWYAIAADRTMELAEQIPGFEALPLQERVATFCFVLLDVMEDRFEFVRSTFRSHAFAFGSPFQDSIRGHLASVLSARDVPAVNRLVVDTDVVRFILSEAIVQMILRWLEDESDQRARSTALMDRVLSLVAEVLANRVPERTVDLLRYLVEAGYLPVDRLPLVGDWLRPESDDS